LQIRWDGVVFGANANNGLGPDLAATLNHAFIFSVLAMLGHLRMNFLYPVILSVGVLDLLFEPAYGAHLPSLVDGADMVEVNSKLSASCARRKWMALQSRDGWCRSRRRHTRDWLMRCPCIALRLAIR